MRSPIPTLFLALALGACVARPAPVPAPPPAGIVSAADPRAAEAGVAILRQGGSAVDAALATMLALTVVEPQSSGIGGGGFLLLDDKGRLTSFDGRETAPAAASPDWFLRDGKPLPYAEARPGGRSTGVPGNVRMMAMAHARGGKLEWKQLFAPAIALARDGFEVTPRLNRSLTANAKVAGMTAMGRELYFLPDGSPKPVGARIRNPWLAQTFEQLAERGPEAFYVGLNADSVAGAVRGAAVNPAPMQRGDLAAYAAQERAPLCSTYRTYRVCGMGPPSSGHTTLFATLKQLERFDLSALGKDNVTSWHLLAESMRLAYADRDRYIADPGFVSVPVEGLLDPAYLAQRSAMIRADSTLAATPPGSPRGAPALALAAMPAQEEHGTSHMAVADRAGQVASLTSTIEDAFGSGLMVGGYFLNNELTDFALAPTGADGAPVANRVEGGKRPRSSMTPTIVYGPDGSVRLAIGAAGGATIIAQVTKAIIGVVDWKLSAQDAIALPVLFAPNDTLWIEKGSALEAMVPGLTALGHRDIRPREGFKANAIERIAGRWVGAADPRSEGQAISE